ncbi:MAG: helix-turn-helix transcriptional regulator [Coriobacteriia bacterium]|nr:helix-turn-helix transcriptional regulator [Coriobacteriia bacterium]
MPFTLVAAGDLTHAGADVLVGDAAVVAMPSSVTKGRTIRVAVPAWGGSRDEQEALRTAYDDALAQAAAAGAQSVALLLLGVDAGASAEDSLAAAHGSVRGFLEAHEDVDVILGVPDRRLLPSRAEVQAFLDQVEEPPAPAAASYSGMPSREERSRTRFGRLRKLVARDRKVREEPCDLDMYPRMAADCFCAPAAAGAVPVFAQECEPDLGDLLRNLDAGFSDTLMTLIDARGLTDAQVYKRANMSRQLFSRIRSNADYAPSKRTVLALAVALELSLDETRDLLARAGFALSRSCRFDVIMEYFIGRGIYDVFTINETLFAFDQPLLGGRG